jgi:hypothetical protein
MNPYNPGLEQRAWDRVDRRRREADAARLAASALPRDQRESDLLRSVRLAIADLRARAAAVRAKPRNA